MQLKKKQVLVHFNLILIFMGTLFLNVRQQFCHVAGTEFPSLREADSAIQNHDDGKPNPKVPKRK